MGISWKHLCLRIPVTVGLLLLGSWTFYHNWLQRTVRFGTYSYTPAEADRMKRIPAAQYAHGLAAWGRQDTVAAAGFFRQAVSENVLFLDGWLRLAEAEAALNRPQSAGNILAFTLDRSPGVTRWKWPQMLLAAELGQQAVVHRLANDLLGRQVLVADTLQFLHTYAGGSAADVAGILAPEHLALYLEWLMTWSMTEESLTVWRAMAKSVPAPKETALQYAHFLLHNRQVAAAAQIWRRQTGTSGLTNPGFETDISSRGFDWCYWKGKDDKWELARVGHGAREGRYALQIDFSGRENISFHHLYQIFTVDPHAGYRLTYAWKSRGLTTDQGPFLEIYGFDREVFYRSGPMMTGTHDWRTESIDFEPPPGCRAVVVRLSRQPSNRFDAKIGGTLWLDDFRLEETTGDSRRSAAEPGAGRVVEEAFKTGDPDSSTR
ncbi:MAG: hypothetical protein WAM73_14995 [Desulfobacterales bacterium]